MHVHAVSVTNLCLHFVVANIVCLGVCGQGKCSTPVKQAYAM